MADRLEDPRVVDARVVRDHEEAIRDGELHIAPRVREQLRHLGLARGRVDEARRDRGEERTGARTRDLGIGADDLGEARELVERVPLDDPLWAHGDVRLYTLLMQLSREPFRRPGIHRAAQHDESALRDVGAQIADRAAERREIRIQELVDRRSDDDDDRTRPAHEVGVCRRGQRLTDEGVAKCLFAALLHERHATR